MAAAPHAWAHELVCEKTVDGEARLEVRQYPAEVTYRWTLFNVHPTDASVAAWMSDSLLFPEPTELNVTIPVGGSISDQQTLTIASYEDCLELAGPEGLACSEDGDGVRLDNRFAVGWDLGEAQCTARVVCFPEAPPPPPPPPPPEEGATRTLGYWKTHLQAAEACIAAGSIDLGFVTIDTRVELLGLLWGSPARFEGGTARSELDQARFLLGRQTAVAICNERLLGADPGTLVDDALAALGGTACADIRALIEPVTAFNESADDEPFPEGFPTGPARPRDARNEALDPTSPSGEACTP